jgi:hypothetical protein
MVGVSSIDAPALSPACGLSRVMCRPTAWDLMRASPPSWPRTSLTTTLSTPGITIAVFLATLSGILVLPTLTPMNLVPPVRETSPFRMVAVASVSIALAVIRPLRRLTPAMRAHEDTSMPPKTFLVWLRDWTPSTWATPLSRSTLAVAFSTLRGAVSTRRELAAVRSDWTTPATLIREPPLTAW